MERYQMQYRQIYIKLSHISIQQCKQSEDPWMAQNVGSTSITIERIWYELCSKSSGK